MDESHVLFILSALLPLFDLPVSIFYIERRSVFLLGIVRIQ